MSILTFPTLPSGTVPNAVTFSLVPNTQAFSSPLDQSTQTVELPGARWTFSLQYPPLDAADARVLKAFLAQLRGMAGRFYLWDHSQPVPRGAVGGSPVVNGAGQSGASLVTSGWSANRTVLKVGDYFQVGGELKIVTADVVSNGSGAATITFEPPLRTSPSNGVAIVTTKASAVFRLVDDKQDRMQVSPGKWHDVSLEGVEAF